MSQELARPHILVVDDDDEFREQLIPEALAPLSPRLRKAKDVLAACLEVAEHNPHTGDCFDLVVLDMHMPEHEATDKISVTGGIEFLRSYDLIQCPVVVFTAYPAFRDCVRAVRAGAAAYLPKKPHDAFDGAEGGIIELLETCKDLLTNRAGAQATPGPCHAWLEENYAWLRQKFPGQWIAMLDVATAQAAGIDKVAHAGYVVLAERSREELACLVMRKLALLRAVPPLILVPECDYS